MSAEREMTLKEWVGRLPDIHLAHKEYEALLRDIEDCDKKVHRTLLYKENKYKATIDKLVANLKEMDEYLNHGHGTSIGCESIFHREIRDLIKQVGESNGT